MGKVEARFNVILAKFENSQIPVSEICQLNILRKFYNPRKLQITIILYFLVPTFVYMGLRNTNLLTNLECLIDMPQDGSKLFRDPEYCEICKNITEIDKVAKISPITFLHKYVKSAHPVVVTDGAKDWPARKLFDFDFFQDLFRSMEINRSKDKNCQFFPYNTDFHSLQEVFNMQRDRALLRPGEKPWYIGWNNCNDEVGRYLNQFYNTPYFLSNMTENIALTWIFMGGPGHGAHMHVDNVHYPSWQAQLSGRKLWRLLPPPECYYQCKEVKVIVEPGEIIVLDTNRWYHQTTIFPGELSITIGSEFD